MAPRALAVTALAAAALGLVAVAAGCGTVGRTETGSVARGKELFQQKCGQCHTLADAGTTGTIGPNLEKSLAGKDKDYIRRGIVAPDADVPDGYQPGIMPPNYEDTLRPEEVDALVTYLTEVSK